MTHVRPAPPLVLECPCGAVLRAEGEDGIVEEANAHLRAAHPDLAGSYSREQILFLTYPG